MYRQRLRGAPPPTHLTSNLTTSNNKYLFILDHFVIEQRVQLFVEKPIKSSNRLLITSNQPRIYYLRNAKTLQIENENLFKLVTLYDKDQPIDNAILCPFSLFVLSWKSFRLVILVSNRTRCHFSNVQGNYERSQHQAKKRTLFQKDFPPMVQKEKYIMFFTLSTKQ